MKFLILLVPFVLISCKAEISNEEDKKAGVTVSWVGHCTKYLKVRKPSNKGIEKADETDGKENLTSDEKILIVNYSIEVGSNDARYIKCSLSDGAHEYHNDKFIPGTKGYLSENYCDIVYDLDSPSFGTFTFSYASDWAWINYTDEDTGYKFDTKFRGNECVEIGY